MLLNVQIKISLAQDMVAYTLEQSPGSERYRGFVRDIRTGLRSTAAIPSCIYWDWHTCMLHNTNAAPCCLVINT